MNNWREKFRNEIILSLIWVVSIIIVNPLGEFPLNDDWAYSQNVFHLSQEGKLILSDWPAMTLIAQVIWGALVTWIFGFSFTVLRFSTLLIGLLTVIVFYRNLLSTNLPKSTSLAGAILLMFSPLFFVSSFSFMTEVYFLFALNLSLMNFFKFFKTEKVEFLVTSSLFVLITTLIRQPGVAVGVAFAVIYLLHKPFSFKRLVISLTPIVIGFVGLFAYTFWIKLTHKMPNFGEFNVLIKQLTKANIDFYLNRFGVIALYCGLFSLPISIMLMPRVIKYSWYSKGIMLFLFVAAIISGLLNGFPSGNVLFNFGLGPKLLKDTYWGENVYPALSIQAMYIIKLLSLSSAIIVTTFFCKETFKGLVKAFRKQSSPARLLRATFIAFFLLYFVFVVLNPGFFDRYVLPLIPSVFLGILPLKLVFSRKNLLVFGISMSVYIFFCIAATHDYMSWNRTRWAAINYLTNEKEIEKYNIDGGFEYNAWFQTGSCNPEIKGKISWWFVSSDDYVISFGNIDGFQTIKKMAFSRLLPPGNDSISILIKDVKIVSDSAFPIKCDCEKRDTDNKLFLSNNIDVNFIGGGQQSSEESLSGEYSIKLDAKNQYGLLSKYDNVKTGEHYIVKVWRKGAENDACLVISVEPNNKFYASNNQIKETNSKGWDLITSEIIIPENCNGYKLGIYVWNPGTNPVWFDDLEIIKIPVKQKEN